MGGRRHILEQGIVMLGAGALSLVLSAAGGQSGSVVVIKLADLAAGEVIQVDGMTVSYDDAEAAHFRVDITNILLIEQYCRLTFTLPTELTGASGAFPATFSTTSAAWNLVDDRAGATSFDPTTGTLVPLPATGDETIHVYIGTALSPDQTSPSGAYSGTLTLHAELVQ